MKFGLLSSNVMQFAAADGLVTLAQGAERAGFESIWTVEHVVFPDGYESTYPYDPSGKMAMAAHTLLPDPLIWLTYVAAVTTTLRLGTGILILPQRNPVVLAKEVATLDDLSAGRVELGIGVGWLQEEFEALGIPFADRGKRTDEHIAAMRALWDGDHAAFDGSLVSFAGVSVNPKPRNGRVPIHVGGHSAVAARRAGRLGDGFMPGAGDLRELIDVMRQAAADAGRDAAAIEVSAFALGLLGDDPLGAAEELADQGVDRALVPIYGFLRDTEDALAAFGEKVVAPLA
jgi:probable F420-dependent oxidoreductase